MQWVGFDFDGTLADKELNPVPRIIKALRQLLQQGIPCKIVTARADRSRLEYHQRIRKVQDFLENNDLPPLEITNEKDTDMLALFDDRAISVEQNSGEILGMSSGVESDLRLYWENYDAESVQ